MLTLHKSHNVSTVHIWSSLPPLRFIARHVLHTAAEPPKFNPVNHPVVPPAAGAGVALRDTFAYLLAAARLMMLV